MSFTVTGPVLPEIRAIQDDMVALRHRIHANPELAYEEVATGDLVAERLACLLYTSPSPRDQRGSRMPSSA